MIVRVLEHTTHYSTFSLYNPKKKIQYYVQPTNPTGILQNGFCLDAYKPSC